MALYLNDFTAGALGATPTGTTLLPGTVEGEFINSESDGVRGLLFSGLNNTPAFRGLYYNGIVSSGKTQVGTLFKNEAVGTRSARLFAFQVDNNNLYRSVFIPASGILSLQAIIAGTFSILAQVTIPETNAARYYNWLFEVEPGIPNVLRAKVWGEGAQEPENFQIEVNEGQRDLSAGGAIGQVVYEPSLFLRHKFFSVGTDGQAAEMPIPAPTLATPSDITGTFGAESVDIGWNSVTGADYFEYEFREV